MVTGAQRARGFTLIEMLTVVSVAVILAMIAVPSFSRLMAAQRIKAAAANLRQALLVTRSEALKRNADVEVLPAASGQWSAGWRVVNPSSGVVLTTYPAAPNLTISGPASITYESSGRISPGAEPTFRIASGAASDLRCVTVTLTGMPSVRSSGC
jgi:type IV fimbrial biogenesis protein FimT